MNAIREWWVWLSKIRQQGKWIPSNHPNKSPADVGHFTSLIKKSPLHFEFAKHNWVKSVPRWSHVYVKKNNKRRVLFKCFNLTYVYSNFSSILWISPKKTEVRGTRFKTDVIGGSHKKRRDISENLMIFQWLVWFSKSTYPWMWKEASKLIRKILGNRYGLGMWDLK